MSYTEKFQMLLGDVPTNECPKCGGTEPQQTHDPHCVAPLPICAACYESDDGFVRQIVYLKKTLRSESTQINMVLAQWLKEQKRDPRTDEFV